MPDKRKGSRKQPVAKQTPATQTPAKRKSAPAPAKVRKPRSKN